jgi:carboxymethylenebutenolidase
MKCVLLFIVFFFLFYSNAWLFSKGVEIMRNQPEGYLAAPPAGKGPGVLVLHAWWGLNETAKSFCRRLAVEGFTVFAPDLYHGAIAETIAEAEALAQKLDVNFAQAKAEIVDAMSYLLDQAADPAHGLVVIGFSLGAFYALDLAADDDEHVRGVVLFYGSGDGDFSASRAAFLGHFAEDDPFEPPDNADGLKAALLRAGRPVTFYTYPGTGHWFFEPDRVDAFDENAASLAWARTVDFLRETCNL